MSDSYLTPGGHVDRAKWYDLHSARYKADGARLYREQDKLNERYRMSESFIPDVGAVYANRITGKRFTFVGTKEIEDKKHTVYLWLPEGAEKEAAILPSAFENAPVLNENMPGWEDVCYYPGEIHTTPGGSTVTILNVFAGDFYQCEYKLPTGRTEVRLWSLDKLRTFLSGDTPAPVDATPAPAKPETVEQGGEPEGKPGPYAESAARVAEIKAILDSQHIPYIHVEQIDHVSFDIKIPQAGGKAAVNDLTYKCFLTPYKVEREHVYVHPVPRDQIAEYQAPSVRLEAAKGEQELIGSLTAKVATKDAEIEALRREVQFLEQANKQKRQFIVNGGATPTVKKSIIEIDITPTRHTQLLNTPGVKLEPMVFVIDAAGTIRPCVAGYEIPPADTETAHAAVSRPVGTMTSIGAALNDLMGNPLVGEVYSNGERVQ